MENLTIQGDPHGNLYKNCKVRDFKIKLPPTKAPPEFFNQIPLDSCEIILMGDSHMRNFPSHHWFAVELQLALNRPVYHMKVMREPFFYFNRSGIKWEAKRRICVWESGEARLYDRYYRLPDMQQVQPEPITRIMFGIGGTPLLTKINNRWFKYPERNYAYFLKNNLVFHWLIELYHTFLFRYFGKISELTPAYSLDPPFLFEQQQVLRYKPSSYFYLHTDALVDHLADNIKIMSDSLSSAFNLEFVFMPTPNSMTLHHGLITDHPYDNYLPRLCTALEERNVRVIKLYDLFLEKSDFFLYHPSDNHWNELGASIAFDEMLRYITELLLEIDGMNPEAERYRSTLAQ